MEISDNSNALSEYAVHMELFPGYVVKVKPRPILDGKNLDGTYKYIIHADIAFDTPDGPFKILIQCPEATFNRTIAKAKKNGLVVGLFNFFTESLPGFGFRPVTPRTF